MAARYYSWAALSSNLHCKAFIRWTDDRMHCTEAALAQITHVVVQTVGPTRVEIGVPQDRRIGPPFGG